MSKLIIANWKNNPATAEKAISLTKVTDQKGLVICPPDKFVADVAPVIKKGKLGAQDLFWKKTPPAKVEYVIIGHSDRRYGLGESNEVVAKKFAAAVKQEVVPILCVGETLEQKQQGKKEWIIEKEISSAFKFQVSSYKLQEIYIAYEPVWAISTSQNAEPDEPENAAGVISFIKRIIKNITPDNIYQKIYYIYGGSINSRNAAYFLRRPEIEGALVGGASLIPDEIKKIVGIARKSGKFKLRKV